MTATNGTIVRRRQAGPWWNFHPYMDHPVGVSGGEEDVVLRVYAPGASVTPEMQVAIVTTIKGPSGNRVEVVDRKWPHTAVPVEMIDPDRMHEALTRVQSDLKLARSLYAEQDTRQSVFQLAPAMSAHS